MTAVRWIATSSEIKGTVRSALRRGPARFCCLETRRYFLDSQSDGLTGEQAHIRAHRSRKTAMWRSGIPAAIAPGLRHPSGLPMTERRLIIQRLISQIIQKRRLIQYQGRYW